MLPLQLAGICGLTWGHHDTNGWYYWRPMVNVNR